MRKNKTLRGIWKYNRNLIALAVILFAMLSFAAASVSAVNESWVRNLGPTNASIFLLIKVDYWNSTSLVWEAEFTALDDITGRYTQGNDSYIALDQFFNGKYNSSENFTHGDGTYRIYAAVTDPENNVLQDVEGSSIEASYNFTIKITNVPPPKVTLIAPANDSFGYDKRSTFNWSSVIDDNGDNVTYRLYLIRTGCYGLSDCINPEVDVDNITGTSYTIEEDLDLDSPYNWTVTAHDGTEYGEESDIWNYTVASLIDISLVVSDISVAGMEPGDNESTEDDSPQPFIVQNKGNVHVNLTVHASVQLWDLAPLGTKYFMFKAGESTIKPASFNMTLSASDWLNMTGLAQFAVANLHYNDTKDYAEIELAVEVPHNEPPGAKSTDIIIEAVGTKT